METVAFSCRVFLVRFINGKIIIDLATGDILLGSELLGDESISSNLLQLLQFHLNPTIARYRATHLLHLSVFVLYSVHPVRMWGKRRKFDDDMPWRLLRIMGPGASTMIHAVSGVQFVLVCFFHAQGVFLLLGSRRNS